MQCWPVALCRNWGELERKMGSRAVVVGKVYKGWGAGGVLLVGC